MTIPTGVKFRGYRPADVDLAASILPTPTPAPAARDNVEHVDGDAVDRAGDADRLANTVIIPTLEAEVVSVTQEIEQPMFLVPRDDEGIDITELAPRKPDWDLKKASEKRLDRIERRTRAAIADIIRRRVLAEHRQMVEKAQNDLKEGAAALEEGSVGGAGMASAVMGLRTMESAPPLSDDDD